MQLFAQNTSDSVTVAEIAAAAGMTSAAVYYHFASKDDILLEGLRSIGESIVGETERLTELVGPDGPSIGSVPVGLLQWFEGRRPAATVWFVTSSGVSLAVEQLRRELRGELMDALLRAAKRARPGISAPEAAVVATALLALVETAASSWLTSDESYTGLGRKRFLEETRLLAERITGP